MKFWILLFYCTISVINAQNVITDELLMDSNSINPSARLSSDDTDNHKPMFKECESYKPSIQEEQDRGIKVVTVKAEDIDPVENGGRITYRILDQEGKRINFKVNNVTGEIVTDAVFDRDEPARQKEVYVTVQATDNGKPSLSDICTFKVTVTDINDNTPSFDTFDYDIKVTEDLKVNSEVARIFAYDSDDGENSRLTYEFVDEEKVKDYFIMDSDTGVVRLKKSLLGITGKEFKTSASVHDNGTPRLSSEANVVITVVTSEKQAPIITDYTKQVSLAENFNDFSKAIINITAESKSDDKELVFELMKGKTTQTNKDQTFILTQDQMNQSASIRMARNLDYETVTEYHLTIRVKNNDLVTSVNIPIYVLDVNDEIPTFLEFLKGSVLENDEPGAQVMQVRAVDKDGTSANNIVKYKLLSHDDLFHIDENTGVITSKAKFDREKINAYHVNVQAYDNSKSALTCCDPNSSSQKFIISIEDRNDNKPQFVTSQYVVQNISEKADIGSYVIEVKAVDKDTASDIHYFIIEGNEGDAFSIEESTGRIKVKNNLDYEKIESYKLTVRAFDNVYDDNATVLIYISNENDEKPIFEPYDKNIELEEEKTYEDCIITLKASDPDIKDKNADQNIIYKIDKKVNYDSILHVSSTGCVTVVQPLDRDKPNGYPQRQFHIGAYDNGGGPNSLVNYAEIFIYLKDINDNAPFLNVTQVVFYENQEPNKLITRLQADDYDSIENGPPFTFRLSSSASESISQKFSIHENGDLFANEKFDREAQKYYDIPVEIADNGNPTQTGTSMFRVIIGDVNDNPAEDGSSEIFVYKYDGLNKDIEIGRVYVTDPDDWDLNDKIFQFEESNSNFKLNDTNKGMIVMRSDALEGTYMLRFKVTEEHLPEIPKHEVSALVNVTIKRIPEEAVRKSGSVRIFGSSIEQFVEKNNLGLSKKDILQRYLAKILNTSVDNVDVLTVIPSPSNESLIDVRFSAHGSPYYKPEKLNAKLTENEETLENQLGVKFVMVSISECLNETVCPATTSCTNNLSIKDDPAVVFTNLTSFVGVKAVAEALCECSQRRVVECFNGGIPIDGGLCSCPEGYEGPNCEYLGIGFSGNGWALYPSLDACNDTKISLSISTEKPDGLIFYIGPENYKHALYSSKEFMSLELQEGILVLKFDFGYGIMAIKIEGKKLDNGAMHKIIISYTDDDIQLKLDECPSACLSWHNKKGVLNTNGPLQLGGMRSPFSEEHSKQLWGKSLTSERFTGCIRNFTFNDYMYNLGEPSYDLNAHINCQYGITAAVSFGIDSNFLVAILVCIAILIILLLAVVVHRRKQDNLNEKDNDDTRENIINYEDEGGGEYDTQFDLSVFPTKHDEKPQTKGFNEIPADINTFLVNKKDTCDKDQENLPHDDVRYYAYEGDGNSTGSLSSLASCTDEGDLKFNYLSNFGPRFRKLADMYGEDPSDEDSQNGGEESWC